MAGVLIVCGYCRQPQTPEEFVEHLAESHGRELRNLMRGGRLSAAQMGQASMARHDAQRTRLVSGVRVV